MHIYIYIYIERERERISEHFVLMKSKKLFKKPRKKTCENQTLQW